jgi:hypothetical protein
MKRSVWLWQLFGFAAVSLCGTLLHFLYDLTGESVWASPFSGVNESTFEHMKLLFWPMLAFAAVQWFFFREREDFFCVKLCGTVLGISLIPLIFCTYNGVIGKSPDFVNIAIFFISAAAAFIYETRAFLRRELRCISQKSSVIALLIIGAIFVLFTFYPPHLELFRDPVTGSYGI